MRLFRLYNCLTANTIPVLIAVIIFFLAPFQTAPASGLQQITSKNSRVILENINEFCKKNIIQYNQPNKTLYYLNRKSVSQASELTINDRGRGAIHVKQGATIPSITIFCKQAIKMPSANAQHIGHVLDLYEKIKNFYAYDFDGQKWTKIKFFEIIRQSTDPTFFTKKNDYKRYTNFWAYDLPNKTWHTVSLIPYLQQTNTQINSDSSAIATEQLIFTNDNNSLNNVAKDELLEELLGVHTPKSYKRNDQGNIWNNFSFDFSIGAGAVFYTNYLENVYLLQTKKHDYFFQNKQNKIFKPNWFHDTLHEATKSFNEHYGKNDVQQSSLDNVTFEGKAFTLPITLGVQYLCWEQLLIGLGGEILLNAPTTLFHNDQAISYKAYNMAPKWCKQGRWFAKCGWYPFYNISKKYRFFGDVRCFYVHHSGDIFPRFLTFGLYLYRSLAYNFGLGYEQQCTDYLSYTMRLAVELHKFNQFANKKSFDYNISYEQPAIYLQIGISVRCTKYDSSQSQKNKTYQPKKHKLDDITKVEGLQDLLGLD